LQVIQIKTYKTKKFFDYFEDKKALSRLKKTVFNYLKEKKNFFVFKKNLGK